MAKQIIRYAPPDPGLAQQTTLESILQNLQGVSTKELLLYILIELKAINYYLHEGLNIKDSPGNVMREIERKVAKIVM